MGPGPARMRLLRLLAGIPLWPVMLARTSASLTFGHPSLSQWHKAVAPVVREEILPFGLGGTTNKAAIAAFYGDKILGIAVALEQQRVHPEADVGYASKVFSEATSNRLFVENLGTILPDHSAGLEGIGSAQAHDAGTMIEAAVAKVHAEADHAAIDDLAKWLLSKALTTAASSNSKGALLEQGGSVESEQLPGFPDHSPRFRAVAQLGDVRAEAEAPNKKESERLAASMIFGEDTPVLQTKERVQFTIKLPDSSPPDNSHAIDHAAREGMPLWTKWFIAGHDCAANLKGDESLAEWWQRGAMSKNRAFHRACMAATVFPERIDAVDVWLKWEEEQESAHAVTVITWAKSNKPKTNKDDDGTASRITCVTVTGSTKNMAKCLVGEATNRLIAERVGVSFSIP